MAAAYPLKLDWIKLIKVAFLGAIAFAAGWALPVRPWWLGIVGVIGPICMFSAGLPALKVISVGEIKGGVAELFGRKARQ
jgi:hypothetical protein